MLHGAAGGTRSLSRTARPHDRGRNSLDIENGSTELPARFADRRVRLDSVTVRRSARSRRSTLLCWRVGEAIRPPCKQTCGSSCAARLRDRKDVGTIAALGSVVLARRRSDPPSCVRNDSLPNSNGSRSHADFFRIPWSSRRSRAVTGMRRPMHRTRRSASRRIGQHELDFRARGGARRGAGRKPATRLRRAPHRSRSPHAACHPLHVTVRLRNGLPSLRERPVRTAVVDALADGSERFGFRLNQFSLQTNHLHLIAEAEDQQALSRGMQGLLVRVARALNRLWKRRGSVFSDRFHARSLRTPREVRSALLYVLANARHHGMRILGIDPYSSGAWFDGWKQRLAAASRSPCVRATTWLLCEGWRRHGGIGVEESPRIGRSGRPSRFDV